MDNFVESYQPVPHKTEHFWIDQTKLLGTV